MSDDWRTRREVPPILRTADEIRGGFVLWSRRGKSAPWTNQGHAAINPGSARALAARLTEVNERGVEWAVFPWGESPNGDALPGAPSVSGSGRSVRKAESPEVPLSNGAQLAAAALRELESNTKRRSGVTRRR